MGIVVQQKFSKLGEKEREQYNKGLKRDGYERFFGHCKYYYTQKRNKIIKEKMQFAHGKKVLEIGSTTWEGWLEENCIIPSSLICINISEIELQHGIDSAIDSKTCPQFFQMDALDLQFENHSFDAVWSVEAGPHRPDKQLYADELLRVLKPEGVLVVADWNRRYPSEGELTFLEKIVMKQLSIASSN